METARVTTVQSHQRLLDIDLQSLGEYSELLGFLVWRDIKVRYRQTAIGVAWFALQPLLATLIFTVVFGRLARLPSDGVPYAVFALSGFVPWQFFANTVTRGVNSMVNERQLISKIYFPRLLLPLAAVLGGVVDFAVGFMILGATLAWYGLIPTSAILLTPLLLLLELATVMAIVCWLAPLNVRYRDVSYVVPFLLQIWMFISPVVYSVELIPASWRWIYGLNPMAGVIEGFRWAWLGTREPSLPLLAASAGGVLLLLGLGLVFFHRMERTFADTI